MKHSKKIPIFMSALISILMSSCAYQPKFEYLRGTQIAPPTGEGLVGLRVNFGAHISYIEFKGVTEGSKTFQIDKPKRGIDLRVLHLPPGKYCQYRFGGNNWYLYDKSPSLCFEVNEGVMSYGGDFQEQFQGVIQKMDYKGFLTQLQREHEDLFNQFFVSN